jgi:toxin ParE1/3/4
MASFLLAAAAYADLEDIEQYTVATWGEEQRVQYLTGLFAQFELVAANPRLGTSRPELGEGVFSLPYERHVIFFELHAGRCHFLRVLHHARDVVAVFSKE